MPPSPAPPDSVAPLPPALRFGRFELRAREQRLLVDGEPLALGGRAFDLLVVLVDRAGELVTRNELIERVWPGRVVEENNLSVQINALRRALGADAVLTVPGRGYRFALRPAPAPWPAPGPPGGAAVPAAASAGAEAVAAAADATPVRTRLPAALPLLIGRSDDLAALGTLIDQHRLITIVGAGGMGKTRVAQALLHLRAAAAPHGVCWVELGPVQSPEALPGVLAVALGLEPASGPPLGRLAQALAGLQMLVALDNAEHLVDAVAALAQALLDAAPRLRLLVTSQVPLRLAAERVWRLAPLAVPQDTLPAQQAQAFAAVALFAERAHAADSRFVLTDAQVPAVIALCRRLDGVALAIELAAARAPALGVARLLDAMSDRLRLLTRNRDRAAPPRQQTLRAALEWSHGLLGAAEQRLFRRLAVFNGGAALERIRAVAADPPGEGTLDEWTLLDALDELVQRSLVDLVLDEADAAPRYRLLESPRALALEQLAAAGEEPLIRTRHARALRAAWDAAEAALHAGHAGVLAWRSEAEPELDAARDALAWACESGDDELALALASALVPRLPPALRDERKQVARIAESIVDRVPDVAAQQRAWTAVAFAGTNRRAADRALDLARQLQRAAKGASDATPAASATTGNATAASATAASATAGDSATFSSRIVLHAALCDAARAQVQDDRVAAAQELMDEADRLEDPRWPPVRLRAAVRARAALAARCGDLATALALNRRLQVLNRAAGDPALQGQLNIADLELSIGDAAGALGTLQALVPLLLRHRDDVRLALARLVMAAAHLALDEVRPAREALFQAWPVMLRIGREADALDYLALVAVIEGDPAAAARLLGAADAQYAARGEARPPNEARARDRAATLVVQRLGDERAAVGIAQGRGLPRAELHGLVTSLWSARG
jgi:predicted ATPase